MRGFAKAVREKMAEAGWQFHHHGKGDHDVWWNPKTGQKLTVPVNLMSRPRRTVFSKTRGCRRFEEVRVRRVSLGGFSCPVNCAMPHPLHPSYRRQRLPRLCFVKPETHRERVSDQTSRTAASALHHIACVGDRVRIQRCD